MRFEGALLVVKDIAASRNFYQEVLFRKPVNDLGVYVVFEGGLCIITETQWSLFNPGLSCRYGGNVFQLGFEEEDIDSFVEHLRQFSDLRYASPLQEYAWGQRSLRLYDPDNHIVEVGEDMKVVTKRFLQSGMTVEQTIGRVQYPPEFVRMCYAELCDGK